MKQLYDLSIIIVNYNARDYLEQCLKSIHKSLGKLKAKIWVVDNASTDGSPEMIKKNFPQIRLIENKENIGFAGANNIALQRCSAPLILLLNNDTLVPEGATAKMVEVMQGDNSIGALGPRLIFEDGSVQISYGHMVSFWNEAWQKFLQWGARKKTGLIKNSIENRSKKSCYPQWVSGACILLRKEALDQVGFFDENFFMYNEDVDLCYRLRQKGWKIFYTPEAEIVHLEGKSASNEAEKVLIEYRRSQLYFYSKYYGRWGLSLLKIYLLFKFSLAYLGAALKTNHEKAKCQKLIKYLLKIIWKY